MIVPEGGEKVFSRSFSALAFRIIVAAATTLLIALIAVTIVYTRLAIKAGRVTALEKENLRLRLYVTKLNDLEFELNKYRDFSSRLAEMAGVDISNVSNSKDTETASLSDALVSYDSESLSQSQASNRPSLRDTANAGVNLSIPSDSPIDGWVTRRYSDSDSSKIEKHPGMDFAAKAGTPVSVTASGVVIFAGWDNRLGNVVIVDHQNGYQTLYGHNKKILVEKGQIVLKGEQIAQSGNTGYSTAPHLHYEIRHNGKAVDPTSFLP